MPESFSKKSFSSSEESIELIVLRVSALHSLMCQPHMVVECGGGLVFTIKRHSRVTIEQALLALIPSLTYNLGGYSAEVPPIPIPNRVVKLSIADGTALRCGRVGSRHFESSKLMLGALFVCDATYSPLYKDVFVFVRAGEEGLGIRADRDDLAVVGAC